MMVLRGMRYDVRKDPAARAELLGAAHTRAHVGRGRSREDAEALFGVVWGADVIGYVLGEAGEPQLRQLVFVWPPLSSADQKLGVHPVRRVAAAADAALVARSSVHPVSMVVLVYCHTMTSPALAACADISVAHQVFNVRSLALFPPDHMAVPRHEVLSAEEAERVKASVSYTLPALCADDAMVRCLGVPRGAVVRIHRNDGQTTPSVVHRQYRA
jgi:DNA-directed RNA polymerase subunit H (RpoH/RPB5)